MQIPNRELTPDDRELVEFARRIVDANTDDVVYTMGAAVRGTDGEMYGGINVFHFTGGPSAELVALGHARASGAKELSTIVAVGNRGRAQAPYPEHSDPAERMKGPAMSNVEYGDASIAMPNEILRTVVGSGVHGIALAGTDDNDEMGVYIEPPDVVLGIASVRADYIWRTQPEGVRSGPGDTDLVLYSLRKYLRLAIKGNPTALLPLYAPDHDVLTITTLGTELRQLRASFLSQQAVQRFLGYMRAQHEDDGRRQAEPRAEQARVGRQVWLGRQVRQPRPAARIPGPGDRACGPTHAAARRRPT